jgi:hypothetical protein
MLTVRMMYRSCSTRLFRIIGFAYAATGLLRLTANSSQARASVEWLGSSWKENVADAPLVS